MVAAPGHRRADRDRQHPGPGDPRRHTPAHRPRRAGWQPTPMIAPLITWVVETGIPRCEAARIVTAAPVSAANPWIGFRSMIFVPIVLMIRTPPDIVPAPIAVAQTTITQIGTWKCSAACDPPE